MPMFPCYHDSVGALQRAYFNHVYNPLYDATTATLNRYKTLQERCIRALELQSAHRILCVGLGTGNEVVAALRVAPLLSVSGIDLSSSALAVSRRKLRRLGRKADFQRMDTAALSYADNSFDRVLCLHVLDFVDEAEKAVREIVRVLSPGGRFVLTLPSRAEGASLAASLARDHVRAALRSGRHPLGVAAELILKFPLGLVYLPLAARPRRRSFSVQQVRSLFAGLAVRRLAIEEDQVYHDFIVTGLKG
jgi:SAM-dependent methyltransferase